MFTNSAQVQGVLDREQEIARQALAAGNKSRALTALRQRKYQDGLLTKTDGQLETLQNLVRHHLIRASPPVPYRIHTGVLD